MSLKEEFKKVVAENIHRDGVDDLVQWLDDSDFFTAPASTKYHDCFEGGLVAHSLSVYFYLKKLCHHFYPEVSEESIAIVSLFHDLCKVNFYQIEMRWRKNKSDKWEQYPVYTVNEHFAFGGHGSKSVFLANNFIRLSPEEAVAINCHMGVENGKWEVAEAFRKHPLAFLLHTADMMSTIDYYNLGKEPKL